MIISSLSRYLHILITTVFRRILKISKSIYLPVLTKASQTYEVDEMFVLVSKKATSQIYLSYGLNKLTKGVVNCIFGGRSKEVTNKFITNLLKLSSRKIDTASLNIYSSLIPTKIHRCFQYQTNLIERNNLTIRNSIKRLSRKTFVTVKV